MMKKLASENKMVLMSEYSLYNIRTAVQAGIKPVY